MSIEKVSSGQVEFIEMDLAVSVPDVCQHSVDLYFPKFYLKRIKCAMCFFLRGD